jgi:hypothetical protein
MSEIYSIRLRATEVDEAYPFLRSYVVADDSMRRVFQWFGLCLSVPLTFPVRNALVNKPLEILTRNRAEDSVTSWSLPQRARIVIPLQYRSRKCISDWIPKKLRSKLADNSPLTQDKLRLSHAPDDTLVHTDEARHICTLCPRQLIAMAGGCAPGCGDCHRHMVIPFDPHTQNAARRISLPVHR